MEFLINEGDPIKTKHVKFISALQDAIFLQEASFLTDIFILVNKLNLNLQGNNHDILKGICAIDSFIQSLDMIIENLQNKNLANFKYLKLIQDELKCEIQFDKFLDNIRMLKNEFKKRFDDFNQIRPYVKLLQNPYSCPSHTYPEAIQNELTNMQCDMSLNQLTYGISFWNS